MNHYSHILIGWDHPGQDLLLGQVSVLVPVELLVEAVLLHLQPLLVPLLAPLAQELGEGHPPVAVGVVLLEVGLHDGAVHLGVALRVGEGEELLHVERGVAVAVGGEEEDAVLLDDLEVALAVDVVVEVGLQGAGLVLALEEGTCIFT